MAPNRTSRILAAAAAATLALTAIVGVTAASAASASPAPAKKNVTLTVTTLPAQVRLIPGESVKVVLSTNLTTGYTWTTKVVGKKSAVMVSKGAYVAPTTDLVGAPGTTTWFVTAKAKGTAVVKFLTTPPGQTKSSVVGSLTVIVR
jgi:predicted secreted protein